MGKYFNDAFKDTSLVGKAPILQTDSAILDTVKDVGISAVKGIVGVGEAGVGLADLATGGHAGKALEEVAGVDFGKTHEILDSGYSERQQLANQKVADATGFIDTASAYLQNPSTIGHAVVESGGLIGAGRAVASKVASKLPQLAGATAGAIGEGVLMAGSGAENIRQQTDDGLLTLGQSGAGVATGIVGGFFGAMGGKLSKNLGVGDIDVIDNAGQLVESAVSKRFATRMVKAGVSEGLFEELPQSMQETIFSNVALGKDTFEGVPKAMAGGLVAGAAMGMGFEAVRPKGVLNKAKDKLQTDTQEPTQEPTQDPSSAKQQQTYEDLRSRFGNPEGFANGVNNGDLSTDVVPPALEGELLGAEVEQGRSAPLGIRSSKVGIENSGDIFVKGGDFNEFDQRTDVGTANKLSIIKGLDAPDKVRLKKQRLTELNDLLDTVTAESAMGKSLIKDVQAIESDQVNTRSNMALLPLIDKITGDSRTAKIFKESLDPNQYHNLITSLKNQNNFKGVSNDGGKKEVQSKEAIEKETATTQTGTDHFVTETTDIKIGDTLPDGSKVTAIRDTPEGTFVSNSDSALPNKSKAFRNLKNIKNKNKNNNEAGLENDIIKRNGSRGDLAGSNSDGTLGGSPIVEGLKTPPDTLVDINQAKATSKAKKGVKIAAGSPMDDLMDLLDNNPDSILGDKLKTKLERGTLTKQEEDLIFKMFPEDVSDTVTKNLKLHAERKTNDKGRTGTPISGTSTGDNSVNTSSGIQSTEPQAHDREGNDRNEGDVSKPKGNDDGANSTRSGRGELSDNEGLDGHTPNGAGQSKESNAVIRNGLLPKSSGGNTEGIESGKNYSLQDATNLKLTAAKRRNINNEVTEILKKPNVQITEADRAILSQFTGSGGLSGKDSAGKGSNIFNQHFTDYTTIKEMYRALDDAGLKLDGRNLEPSAGSGNFIGMMPNATWDAVEIDEQTARIASILYPKAKVFNESFETFEGSNYDLIISNVPFASVQALTRKHMATVKPQFRAIHNFFFAHAMDKVKEGGVVAFMTSTSTMDGRKEATKLRASLISEADMIGAYRLPQGTQKDNATTDVSIDIIFLQKRPKGAESKIQAVNQSFIELGSHEGHTLNQYFIDNPSNILGTMAVAPDKTKMGRDGLVVTGTPDYSKIKLNKQSYRTKRKVAKSAKSDTELYANYNDLKDAVEFSAHSEQPFYKAGVVYDEAVTFPNITGGALIGRRLADKHEDAMADLREIEKTLDVSKIEAYKKKYKIAPSESKALKAWAKRHYATEQLNSLTALFDKDFNPSEIFSKQVRFKNSGKLEITKDSPIEDRLEASENDEGIISRLATEFVTPLEISESNQYATLSNGDVQNNRLYYAGNIYKKLSDANTIKDDGSRTRQIKKLNSILPDRIKLENITIKGYASWMPDPVIDALGYEEESKLFGINVISSNDELAIYNNWIRGDSLVVSDSALSPSSNAQRLKGAQLILKKELIPAIKKAVVNAGLTTDFEDAYNQAKNFHVDPVFDGSSIRNMPPVFRGKPFKLYPYQQRGIERAVYNKKGVIAFAPGLGKTPTAIIIANQLLRKGIVKKPLFIVPANTIGQWEASTLELYPDANVFEFPKFKAGVKKGQGKEWQDMTAIEKESMLNNLTNNQYDYTFISSNLATKLTIPLPKFKQYVKELVADIQGMELGDDPATATGRTKSELRAVEANKAKMAMLTETMIAGRKEQESSGLDMEKLGFDAIFADEVQDYKNIGVSGLGKRGVLGADVTLKTTYAKDAEGKSDKNQDPVKVDIGSARSYGFRFKTRYISDMNNGNNIFMLTGTPTPNKPLELFTLLQHMDTKLLEEYGINNVADFVQEFFVVESISSTDASGKAKMKSGLTSINNIELLRKITSRYVDYVGVDDAEGVVRPKQKDYLHSIRQSADAREVMADIQERLEQAIDDASTVRSQGRTPDMEEVITIYGAGRDASIDVRLYKPSRPVIELGNSKVFKKDTNPKTSKFAKTVDLVSQVIDGNKEAGQLIFIDRVNFPKSSAIEGTVHEDLRQDILRKTGLKPEEVGILTGAQHVDPDTGRLINRVANNAKKSRIMKAYNDGSIRVLVGATSQMGVGVDLQADTTDLYLLDIPYRPDHVEQRIARAVRQGNKNSSVNVHSFIQPLTFDEMSYRILESKQGFNDVFWKPQTTGEVEIATTIAPDVFEAAIELASDPVEKQVLRVRQYLTSIEALIIETLNKISGFAERARVVRSNMLDTQGVMDRKVVIIEDVAHTPEDVIPKYKAELAKLEEKQKLATEKLKKISESKAAVVTELQVIREKLNKVAKLYLKGGAIDENTLSQSEVDKDKVREHLESATPTEGDLFSQGEAIKTSGLTGVSVKQLTKMLPAYAKKMLLSGRLKIVASATDIGDGDFKKSASVRGVYRTTEDVIYLVAGNLSESSLASTLNHEIYHRASLTDKKLQKKVTAIKRRASEMFVKASKGLGDTDTLRAYNRALNSSSNPKHQLEEFQAYLVSEYNSGRIESRGVIAWVKSLLAGIKTALLRNGIVSSNLTGKQLHDIAIRYGTGTKERVALSKGNTRKSDQKRSNNGLRRIIDGLTGESRKSALARARTENDALRSENEKLRKELYSSDITPLQNRRVWNNEPKKKYVVSMDADSLKWVNDNMSHDAGNELLRLAGQAIKDSGIDGFHVSGDEFMATHDDKDFLETELAKVSKALEHVEIRHTLPSGEVIIYTRVGLSFGIGETTALAEIQLHTHKADREKRGLRMDRDLVGQNKAKLQAIVDAGRIPSFNERKRFTTDPPKVKRISAKDALAQKIKPEPITVEELMLDETEFNDLFDDDGGGGDGVGGITDRIKAKVTAVKTPVDTEAYAGLDDATLEAVGNFGGIPKSNYEKAEDYITESRTLWKRKFRQGIVDQFDSFKNVLNDNRAWMMAHLSASAPEIVVQTIHQGIPVLQGSGAVSIDTSKKGLIGALKPLGAESGRFLQWIAGQRAQRLALEGKENRLTDEHIESLIALGKNDTSNGTLGNNREKLYTQALKDFNSISEAVNAVGVKSGMISELDAEIWANEGIYVPFYRLLEESATTQGISSVSGLIKQDAYKTLKGADMQIDDLLANVLMNWTHILGASLKNQAATRALDVATTLSSPEGRPLAVETAEALKRKDAVFVRRNGQKIWYNVDTSAEGKLVLDSLVGMNFQGLNNAPMKVMRKFKKWMTLGVTKNPAYIASNLFKDTFLAVALNKMDVNIFSNLRSGYHAGEKDSDLLIQAGAGGAIVSGSHFSYTAYTEDLKEQLKQQVDDAGVLSNPSRIKKVLEAYNTLGNRVENLNRMAQFEKDLANGDIDLLEANFRAKDHFNYSSTGSSIGIRVLTQTIPFLNSRIQGLDKVSRAWEDEGQRTQLVKVATLYVGASLLMYLSMRDDEDYINAEQWERDSYHLFKVPNTDVMLRLPRAFELGMMATIVERSFEQMLDDKVHSELFVERMTHIVTELLGFVPVPQAFKPVLELWANKDSFTGRHIESASMQRLSPSERKKAWTSQTAIGVSSAMDTVLWDAVTLSPIQVDHMIKGWFGWLGGFTTATIDNLALNPLMGKDNPDWEVQDYMGIGRFARTGQPSNSRFITEFYDTQKQLSRHFADIQKYKEDKEWGKYDRAIKEHGDKLKNRHRFNAVGRKLNTIRTRINTVYRSKSLSGAQKRVKMDRLNKQRITLAKKLILK